MFFLFFLFGLALSAPVENKEVATILKYENNNNGLGSYKFEFETSDGSRRKEEGVLKNAEDPEHSFIAVSGSYSYIGPDGVLYSVTYVADENGFQPAKAYVPDQGVMKPLPRPTYSPPQQQFLPEKAPAFPPHVISILG